MFNVSQTHSNLWKMRLILLLLHVWGNLHVSLSQNEIICHRMDIENAVNRDPYSLTYKNNERVYYECREGFTGSPFRTCTANGWTGTSRCTEITCNREDYSYAVIEGTAKSVYKYNEQVDYVCNNGYVGRFTLTCGKGRWKGTQSCMRKPCNRPELMDANIRGAVKQSYSNNEKIQYVCTYSQEVHEAKCEEGVWTGITNCSACPKAVIPHGFAVGAQGDKLTYTCDEGYKLFNKGWWGDATCVNHQWSGLEQCIGEIQCGEIPAIANGEALPIQKPYDENDGTEIRCNEGFEAQVTHLICHKGEWSSGGLPLNTICTARTSNCDAPPKVDNAIITTTYKNNYLTDSEVVYKCRNKYMLVGEGSLRCLDGKWEEKNITCAQLKCLVPEIENGYITEEAREYRENEILHFSCNKKFKRREDRPSKCTKVGMRAEWSPTPECEPIKCLLQLPPLEGTTYEPASKSVFVPGETLRVTCEGKFYIVSPLETVAETTCDDDGQWTINPVCKGLKTHHDAADSR